MLAPQRPHVSASACHMLAPERVTDYRALPQPERREEDMSQRAGKTTNRRHRLDVGIDAPRGEKMCMKMNHFINTENKNQN